MLAPAISFSSGSRTVCLVQNGRRLRANNCLAQPVAFPTLGGQLAQLVRVPASHAGGHWFDPSIAHHLFSGPCSGFPAPSGYFKISRTTLSMSPPNANFLG